MFCGQPASTKEHAWPEWLLELLGGGRVAVIQHERGNEPMRTWRGVGAGVTVKHVCRTRCNNGWMSDLEDCAKPILTPLVQGVRSSLDTLSQITIATWAVKTAMVFEATRVDHDWFYTREERRYVMEESTPPARTSVWIGSYSGRVGAFCQADDLGGRTDGALLRFTAYATTMSFGPLVIQVNTGHLPPRISKNKIITADQSPGPWDAASVRVWPATRHAARWPAPVSLDDGDANLERYAMRWSPTRR
jgi:hypothetical protein